MEDFPPKGTPEANNSARRVISQLYTGNPEANEKDLLRALGIAEVQKNNAEGTTGGALEGIDGFLVQMEAEIMEWMEKLEELKLKSGRDSSQIATAMFLQVIKAGSSYREAWNSIKGNASKTQQKTYKDLSGHIRKIGEDLHRKMK